MTATFRQAILFSLRVWAWGLLPIMFLLGLVFTAASIMNYTWWDRMNHFKSLVVMLGAFGALTLMSAVPGLLITAWMVHQVSRMPKSNWNKRILVFVFVSVLYFLPGACLAYADTWFLPATAFWIPLSISLFLVPFKQIPT